MSDYQVLARKYRPKNFSELLGQTHVSQALSHAIDTGRLHHAYLFTGTRGVGKTTIARILAKCLNCETGITSTPCGVCDTCVSVDNGRFIDLIEIDAASRTKVEDTRDLLENVPYAPTQGRYKVYLIDEVHMLSTHSFNALLKTLEEPPEHVKFILATTDPQKLPITIISRCLQFVLRPMSQELLHEHLSKILQNENISYSYNAVWQLAQSAKGSVRDALSLTDQAIAFGGGSLNDETVVSMLGLVDGLDVLNLIRDIYLDNRSSVANHISRLRTQMVDAVAVLDRLVDSLHELAMMQFLPVPLDKNDTQKQAFTQLSAQIPADVLQLYYEIAIKSRDSVRLATTPMQALEMGILRLLAFRPLLTNEILNIEGAPVVGSDIKDVESPDGNQSHNDHSSTGVAHGDDTNGENLLQTDDLKIDNEINAVAHDNDLSLDELHQEESIELDLHDPASDKLTYDDKQSDAKTVEAEPSAEFSSNDTIGYKEPSDDVGGHIVDDQIDIQEKMALESSPANPIETNDAINQQDELISQTLLADNQTNLATNPKQALKAKLIAPQVELSGEWTAQKWDYWLALARQEHLFNNDELALLHSSRMVGEIDGKSTLHVDSHNSQVDVSFNSAKTKIAERLPNMQLQDDLPLLDVAEKADIPYQLQKKRDAQVMIDAQNQIIQSPVVQTLWQQGFIDDHGEDTRILSGTKLTLDD